MNRYWNFSSSFDYIMEQKGDKNTEILVQLCLGHKIWAEKFGP